MNMPDKAKDGPKARKDLQDLKMREDLHMPPRKKSDEIEMETEAREKKGKNVKEVDYCPPYCFTLSQAEIDQFFKCLIGVKVSSDYCGKISRYLDTDKKRFSGMKSHDCHVMMMQILPVALRGITDKHVRDMLIGLCTTRGEVVILNELEMYLSRKSISLKQL